MLETPSPKDFCRCRQRPNKRQRAPGRPVVRRVQAVILEKARAHSKVESRAARRTTARPFASRRGKRRSLLPCMATQPYRQPTREPGQPGSNFPICHCPCHSNAVNRLSLRQGAGKRLAFLVGFHL